MWDQYGDNDDSNDNDVLNDENDEEQQHDSDDDKNNTVNKHPSDETIFVEVVGIIRREIYVHSAAQYYHPA